MARLGRNTHSTDLLAEHQLTIAVLRYQLDHPGAVVDHQKRKSYSPQYRRFVLERLDTWRQTMESFSQATEIPLDTLRQWLKTDSHCLAPLPEKSPPVMVYRDSSQLVFQIARAWDNWQGSKRDFIKHTAAISGLLYGQVVRVLRLLGIITACGPKKYRHRGSTTLLSPGSMLVTDGKALAVNLTGSNQWETWNWQAMVDQATGCDTAVVISKEECAAAVKDAYDQSVDFAGGRYPLGLLHDNKPCYDESKLQNDIHENGSLMIPATMARAENKAIIEGEFGLFEQRVGTIRLDDTNRQTLLHSAVEEVIRAYTAATNAVPRENLGSKSRQKVFCDACPGYQKQEQDRRFLQNLKAKHQQNKSPHRHQDPSSRKLLDTVFVSLDLLAHDPSGSLRNYLASFQPAAIRQAAVIVKARKERGLVDQEYLHRYLAKVIQNKQEEMDLELAASELMELCRTQGESWTKNLEQDYQLMKSQNPLMKDQVFEVAKMAAHSGLLLDGTFWTEKLQKLLTRYRYLIGSTIKYLVRLFEAPNERRLALVDQITAMHLGVR